MSDPPTPQSTRKQVSAWKVLGILLGMVALLIGASALWIRSVADRRWAAMERETLALYEEAVARDSSRPVLRGEAIEGNAWDDYAVATKVRLGNAVLAEYISRGPKANRAAVEAILAANPTVLDSLRRGALRTHAQYPFDWKEGFDGPWRPLGADGVLTYVAVCKARLLAETGHPREAMEVLLDAAQFARDLHHNSTPTTEMLALAYYDLALGELCDLVVSGKLTSEDLAELGRGLDLADRSFPRSGYSLRNDTMLMGFTLLGPDGKSRNFGEDPSEIDSSVWRYGFSKRLMEVDALDTVRRAVTRLTEAEEKPWLEFNAIIEKLVKEAQDHRNPLTRYLPGMLRMGWHGRVKRAQLRLLRVAAHYRATGEVLDLDDPFGGKLVTAKTGKTLKIWSVGPNGVDDGGSGNFRGMANPPSTDLVLEVER